MGGKAPPNKGGLGGNAPSLSIMQVEIRLGLVG